VTFGLSHPEFLSKFSRNDLVFNCESDQKCLKLEDQKRRKQIKKINNCKTSANCKTAERNRHCSNNKSTNSPPLSGNKTVLLETIASFSQALSSHPCGMSKPPLEAPVTVSIVGRTRRIKCDKLFSSDRNPGWHWSFRAKENT